MYISTFFEYLEFNCFLFVGNGQNMPGYLPSASNMVGHYDVNSIFFDYFATTEITCYMYIIFPYIYFCVF